MGLVEYGTLKSCSDVKWLSNREFISRFVELPEIKLLVESRKRTYKEINDDGWFSIHLFRYNNQNE